MNDAKALSGTIGLNEMIDKVTDWYNWTVREEIAIHPYNDYVAREFLEKIQQWMYPYIHRMWQQDFITLGQLNEFKNHVDQCVFDLRVKAEQATWQWHWNQKSFLDRMKWRLENKRFKKYGRRDFERMCEEARFIPYV